MCGPFHRPSLLESGAPTFARLGPPGGGVKRGGISGLCFSGADSQAISRCSDAAVLGWCGGAGALGALLGSGGADSEQSCHPTKRQGNPVARIPLSIRYVLVDPTGIEPVTS